MKTLYRRSVSSVNVPRLFAVLVLASLLFSALPALSPPATGAQDGEVTPTPTAEVQASDTVATAEPTEPAEPAEPAPEAQGGGVANYIAEARACPPGFDPAAGDASAALASCIEPLAGVAFTLGTQNPSYPGDTRTTSGDGIAVWSDIPLGTGYTVAESVPQGNGDPWVYCEISGGPGPDQNLFFPATGGFMDVGLSDPNLANYAQTYCRWFNIPPADPSLVLAQDDNEVPAGSGSVTVYGYICADALYDPAQSLQTYLDICQTPHSGGKVRLYSAVSGTDQTAEIAGNAPLAFPDVPPGETELNLLGGSNLNRLFCTTYAQGEAAPPVSAYSEAPVTADIEAGYETSCYWFNFQELPDDAYVTITIEKHLCGPEYPDSSSVDDWRQGCPDPHPGVTFEATQSGAITATGTTDAAGLLTLRVLPGDVNILEAPPDEFPGGYAWCGIVVAGAAPEYVNAGRLNPGDPNMPLPDVTPGQVYSCEWFNAPLEGSKVTGHDGGNVTILKWRCPEGYDIAGASIDQLRADCSTPQDGVQIGVYYENGAPFTELTRLEKGPAIARFEGLPPGKVGIGETGPSARELQRVFCSTSDIGQAGSGVIVGYTEYTVADGGIAATVEAGKVLECNFFNVPVKGYEDGPPKVGEVFVDKRTCPPGFAAVNSSYVDIAMYCASEPGVGFKITQGETVLSAVTDGSGIAKFTDVPFGIFRISELQREGHDPPRVFCRFTLEGEGSTGNLDPVVVDNWSVPTELKEGYFLECVWANMPAASTSTDPSNVTLHNYVCPGGTGEYASLEKLRDTCTAGPEGIAFTVSLPLDLAPKKGTTDAGGNVAISGLTPDFYSVDEVSGQGYKPISAWCTYGNASGASEVARYSAQPLYLYLAGGKSAECAWFSVPYIEPARAVIVMRVCPADFPLVDVTNDKILSGCPVMPSGVQVAVQSATGSGPDPASEPYQTVQATNQSGEVFFEDVSPASIRISERSAAYQTVHVNCGSAARDEFPSSYQSLATANEGIDYQAESNTDIFCYWATKAVPPSDIAIWVSSCLPYYEFEAADLEYLSINCTPEEGVDFSIEALDGSYEKSVATSVAGLAVFEDVPPAVLTMTEAATDLRTVRVFCGTPSSGYINQEFNADATEYVTKGENVTCYWFTIKTTYSRITLYKYACPEDYVSAGQTYDELLQACPAPLPGIRFDFVHASGADYDTTDDEGVAGFNDVSPGPWTITETPPAEYSGATVFCREVTPGQPKPDFAQVPVQNFAIETQVEGGNQLECHWFNTKTHYATVTIHKYACDEEYVPHSYEDVLEECPAPQEGVTFTLGGPATELSRATDASGTVSFEEVASGPLFISETPPDGYAEAVVYCATLPAGPEFEEVPVEQLSIEREVEAGDKLECNWFNYAEPDQPSPTPSPTPTPGTGNPSGQPGTPTPAADAPASLIITKHTCAAGYELHRPDADPAEECDEPAEDIEFTLSALNDRDSADTVSNTDDDGVVAFTELAPGPWLLTETLPERTQTTFILECASDRRDFQLENPFTPFAYAGPAGEIGVALLPGETLACDSYTVPQSGVSLLAYHCPGVQVDIAACAPAKEPVTFRFIPVDDGEPFTLTTDDSGVASAALPTGVYGLTDPPATTCLIDSEAFDTEGNLVVEQGKPIELRVYSCGEPEQAA